MATCLSRRAPEPLPIEPLILQAARLRHTTSRLCTLVLSDRGRTLEAQRLAERLEDQVQCVEDLVHQAEEVDYE